MEPDFLQYINRIQLIEKWMNPQKQEISNMLHLLEKKKYDELDKALVEFPMPEDILKELVESLKGKPVYKTLKKISEGKSKDQYTNMKGLFSLGCHAAIKMEDGQLRYGMILPLIHHRIGELIMS